MRRLVPAVFATVFTATLIAAPVPKGKEDFGPVTDEQLKEAAERMKQIGLALHAHYDTHGFLPKSLNAKDGKPGLSWRVAILPFLEEDALYKEFKVDEGWDSEHNKKLIEKLPKIYAPIRVKAKEKGHTFYQGFDGPDTTFEAGRQLTLKLSFPDGTSTTIGVVEAGEPVVWTKPEDIKFNPKKDLPPLGGLFDGDFHVLFMDGSVRKATGKKVNATEFKKLVTKSDSWVVNVAAILGEK